MKSESPAVGKDARLEIRPLEERIESQLLTGPERRALADRSGQEREPAFDRASFAARRRKTGGKRLERFGPAVRGGGMLLGPGERGEEKERQEHGCRFSPCV